MKKIDGQPVVNAKRGVTFVVTPADIKKAARKNSAGCVAAIACMRELSATAAQIHTGRTYLNINGKWTRFRTPPSLRAEIIAYDRGGEFEPGEHRLLALSENDMEPRPKTGNPDKKKRRAPMHIVGGIRPNGKASS